MNKAIWDELMRLSPSERLDLADRLRESVDPNDLVVADDLGALTDEQMQEIRRRLAEHEADPSSAIPWEEVRARLWARLK